MLVRAKRHQLLRQRNMICEAASTFFILDKKDKFTICNVILQNADQLDRKSLWDLEMVPFVILISSQCSLSCIIKFLVC